MEAMVLEVTGVKVLSLHHDISTVTGEEVVLFTLAGPPQARDTKKTIEPAESGQAKRAKRGLSLSSPAAGLVG